MIVWEERCIQKCAKSHAADAQSVRALPDLARVCAQNVQNEFRGRGGQHAYNTIMLHTQPSIPSSLKFKWAAPEMVEGALLDDDDSETPSRSAPSLLFRALCLSELMPAALL